jgi:hypothetical protein
MDPNQRPSHLQKKITNFRTLATARCFLKTKATSTFETYDSAVTALAQFFKQKYSRAS